MKNNKPHYIILLNGVSSSGKSAIINELTKLNKDLKIVKIDDWFPEILKQKVEHLGWKKESNINPWIYLHDYAYRTTGKYYFDTEIRELFFDEVTNFYQKAKKFYDNGNNVIIDTVLEYEKEYNTFNNFFNGDKVLKILVYCPMNILYERVEKRNKSGEPEEYRTVFQSFEQFPAMYKIQENTTDQIIDKVKSNILKDSLDKAIQQLIDNKIPDPYLPKLQEFKKEFIKKFKLDLQEEIIIVAKHKYDLILNSYINDPAESAKKIIKLST